jgi:hypothetical protein
MKSLRIEHGTRCYEIGGAQGAGAVKLYDRLERNPRDAKALKEIGALACNVGSSERIDLKVTYK